MLQQDCELLKYCKLLKYYSNIINKHLNSYKRLNSAAFYNQGPGSGYASIRNRKEQEFHNDYITFNSSFTQIYSELGNLQLCGCLSLNREEIQKYEDSKKLIIRELNLIEKTGVRTHDASGTTWNEKYYILDNQKYLDTHTYKEVQDMWKHIN